jgi:hypothetical protein
MRYYDKMSPRNPANVRTQIAQIRYFSARSDPGKRRQRRQRRHFGTILLFAYIEFETQNVGNVGAQRSA